MSENVYKKIELVGSSPTSIEEAVMNALARADQDRPKHALVRGHGDRGHTGERQGGPFGQVTLKVGFTLDK